MSVEVPADRRYLPTHEWVRTEDGVATVGISAFAQDELGDVVFVELPAVGEEVVAGERFGTVESVKAVSDLYAPVGGTVSEVNERLEDRPDLLNEDPFGDGWLIRIAPADVESEATLSAAEYRETVA